MTSGQQEPRSLTNRMAAVIFHAVDFDQLEEVKCVDLCYFKSYTKLTYAEGAALCNSLNTKMVYLKNEAENNALKSLVDEPIYLLTRVVGSAFFNDGDPVTYGKWDCDIFSKKDNRCVKRLKSGFMTTTSCNAKLTVLVGCIHNMVLPNSCSGRTPLMSAHSHMITFKLLKETLPAVHHCVAINTQTVAAWS
uniref:C-type lectin domain-containing protein n=1 Tax=Echinococcus canadensis TaxID=519352 RepID=A0A915EUZ2_9CEST